MNIDSQQRKPFRFLRKGDGLQRYSSLAYPRYRKKNIDGLPGMNEKKEHGFTDHFGVNDPAEGGRVGKINNATDNGCENMDDMGISELLKRMNDDDAVAATGVSGGCGKDDAARMTERPNLEKPVDSGKGTSSPENLAAFDVISTNSDLQSSPKEDADTLEPSLLDRRIMWEAREQRERVEANHFEALERFLAAMNSTLKSESSAFYKTGALGILTPTAEKRTEPVARTSATNAIQNPIQQQNVQTATSPVPPAVLQSPVPIPDGVRNGLAQHLFQPSIFPDRLPWTRAPHDRLPPSSYFPSNAPAPFPSMERGCFDPLLAAPGMAEVEKDLRALMTNLEQDVEELQRRRSLFDEHVDSTRSQLCSEWQRVEQERELVKIQRMKLEQDKNDLFTHRAKMEEEVKTKLEKAAKSETELKMLQTENQLLKKKLVEQKKLSSDEISSIQQQVIDLQRQAVETDSRASSLRTQITRLKEECRQYKEDVDTSKTRNKILESSNERLRVENAQLRSHWAENRDKTSNTTGSVKTTKAVPAAGDQGRAMQTQTPKCVRFADEQTTFRRTRDFCVQAAGPSDMGTQTSFVDTSGPVDNWMSCASNAVLQRSLGNGKREIIYPNDTVQILDAEGAETVNYPNGDVLRCLPDGSKVYRSAADGRTEIRHADGSQIVRHADGSAEKHAFMENGTEVITYSNGTVVEKRSYGVEVAYLYDKSKETRCSHYTLREFPSGDIKKLFADGSTETRLVCGRVRVKDAQGNVVKDTDEYSSRIS